MNTTEYEQMMNDLNDLHDCESGLGFTPEGYFNEEDPDLYSYDDILA